MEEVAKQNGFPSVSDYLRSLLRKDLERRTKANRPPELPVREYHSTALGTIWNGDVEVGRLAIHHDEQRILGQALTDRRGKIGAGRACRKLSCRSVGKGN